MLTHEVFPMSAHDITVQVFRVSHTVHAFAPLTMLLENNMMSQTYTRLNCVFYRMLKRMIMWNMHLSPREDDQTRIRPTLWLSQEAPVTTSESVVSSQLFKTVIQGILTNYFNLVAHWNIFMLDSYSLLKTVFL